MKGILTIFLTLFVLFVSHRSDSSELQVVRIGLVFDFSGKAEAVNDLVDGIELYVSEVNKKIKRIELYRFDSAGGPLETKLAIEKAANLNPKLDFLIAELDSSKAFVAAEGAEARKIPMITPLASCWREIRS